MLTGHFIALIVTSATHAVLSLFVFSKGRYKLTNTTYALYSASIAFWSGFEALAIVQSDPAQALFLWRLNHVGVIFIPIFFAHFVISLLGETEQEKRRPIILVSYALGIIFLLFNFTGFLIVEVVPKFYFKHFINPGRVYLLFFTQWVLLAIYGLFELFRLYFESPSSKKQQLSYFSISMFIAYIGGVPNFLPTFNILTPILMPYGTYAIAIYAFFTTYAIVAHKLMDIEVIIRRTAVFAGLFAFVYGTFTVITVLGKEFFKNTLGWNEWMAMVPTVAIITFALRPLENFLTEVTEKFLFQKKYDYRELLRTFTKDILTTLELQTLVDETVARLMRIVKLESAALFLTDHDRKKYRLMASSGVKERDITLNDGDGLITALKVSRMPLLKDKSVDKMQEQSDLRVLFKKLNAQVALPIIFQEDLIGILFLGMKKSGEDYSREEIDNLMTLVGAEAIAISNAQHVIELSQTQAVAAQHEKMAVIGTLAAGINHEICNPLGIVRGQCEMFLLNSRDGFYKEKSADEMLRISSDIMTKVIKETDRATAITKKLSTFAKPSKAKDFESVAVDKEADEVLSLVEHDLSLNNIKVEKNFVSDFPHILADKKQIQEVLFNIIRNAAQAMDKKDGKIALSGYVQNGSVVVKIADNGRGIPADKLDQIFNPFYTTKAPGKGTGLGLFIVKQVVERNKGTISVESQAGIGTTFILMFNAEQRALAA